MYTLVFGVKQKKNVDYLGRFFYEESKIKIKEKMSCFFIIKPGIKKYEINKENKKYKGEKDK